MAGISAQAGIKVLVSYAFIRSWGLSSELISVMGRIKFLVVIGL